MAERRRLNQLSPPLMHVFRDAHQSRHDEPAGGASAPTVRARTRFPITERVLKQEVQRDLDALMNTVCLESAIPLDEFSQVRRSILNHGIPDIGHRTLNEHSITDLCSEIAAALIAFEPRLLRQTIRVRRERSPDDEDSMSIRFLVQADLVCDPQNLPVEFVADVEVQSGKIAVGRV